MGRLARFIHFYTDEDDGADVGPTNIVSGNPPLSLVNAIAKKIRRLIQYGKCEVSGDEIICNNGTLTVMDDELPSGYKRLLGITFDGSVRYETGEALTGNDDVTMTLDNLSSSGKNVFGSYNGANDKNFSLYIYGSTSGSYFRFGDQLKRPKYGSTGQRTITFGASGTSGFSENTSVDPDEFTTPANVYIGMLPNSSSGAYTGDIIGSILVSNRLEWIPCENPDGVIGYYEKYNGNFIAPSGSGTPVSLGYDTSHNTVVSAEGTPEEIKVTGANQWDETWEQGSIDNSTGENKTAGSGIRCVGYIHVASGASYYIYTGDNISVRYYWYDSAKKFLSSDSVRNGTITAPSSAKYLRIRSTGDYGNTYKNNWSVNYPSTDTDYHPAHIETATASNLFAVGSVTDEQDIISGTITRRCEAVVSDGTTPSGRYIGTVGEGNILVCAKETGYSGAIASFTADKAEPLNGLVAQINPVQDLHGYENPWPAGGGVNKFNPASAIIDGQWISGAGSVRSADACHTPLMACASGDEYTISASPTSGDPPYSWSFVWYSGETFLRRDHTQSTSSAYTITAPTGADNFLVQIAKATGSPVTLTLAELEAYRIQLEVGSSATTWKPYANECPITGWTGLTGKMGGKNLLPMPITSGSYANNVTVTVNPDLSFYISKPNGTNWTTFQLGTFLLKAGTYYLFEISDGSTNASLSLFDQADNTIASTRWNKNRDFTLTTDTIVKATYARAGQATDVLTKLLLTTTNSSVYEPYITPTPIECSWFGVLGKNLFDPTANPDKWINASGQLVDVTGAKASQKISCAQGDSFAVSTESGVSTLAICFYASDDSVTQRTAQQDVSSLTATAPANTAYVISATYGESGKEVQLERGTSATAYESYRNTVYGGSVEVVSGAMVVDRAKFVLDSTIPSGTNGFRNISVLTNGVRAEYYPYRAVGLANSVILSDKFRYGSVSDGTPFIVGTSETNQRMYITLPLEYDTEEKIRAWFASNPSEFVYYLATPQTYQLTPQQIETLVGQNSIWVDTGDVTAYVPDFTTEKVAGQSLSTTEGTNTVFVTSNVDPGEIEVEYRTP